MRVSEVFRDPPFFRAFRERVVPILRTYPLLKIWHAGCASGEEVYTTAILLSEENLYERAQIYATDMSPSALEMAREGVYPEERAANFERNYLESGGKGRLDDYFSRAYGRIVVREGLATKHRLLSARSRVRPRARRNARGVLPQRADLLRSGAAGTRARPPSPAASSALAFFAWA